MGFVFYRAATFLLKKVFEFFMGEHFIDDFKDNAFIFFVPSLHMIVSCGINYTVAKVWLFFYPNDTLPDHAYDLDPYYDNQHHVPAKFSWLRLLEKCMEYPILNLLI